jgi:hypothetical protein
MSPLFRLTETFSSNLLTSKLEKVLILLLLALMAAVKAHSSESSVDFGPLLVVCLRDPTYKNYFMCPKDPTYHLELSEIKWFTLIQSKQWTKKVKLTMISDFF